MKPQHGKYLRCAIKDNSPHSAFWNEAIKVLASVTFIRKDRKEFVPPSIKNWIITIRGFQCIWTKLKKAGFEFLSLRNLNQDPLENFFGCIRSHGIRNVNPTCASFVASFKTLVVNNFFSSHSVGSNCEEDESDGALDLLKQFVGSNAKTAITSDVVELGNNSYIEAIALINTNANSIVCNTHSYIAGSIIRTIFKKQGACSQCKKDLIATESSKEHMLTEVRAYSPKALIRANTQFTKLFSAFEQICRFYLPKICTTSYIQQQLRLKLRTVPTAFTCKKHDLQSVFIEEFLRFFIKMYITNINNILKGMDLRRDRINDDLKKLAYTNYVKNKGRHNKIAKIKMLNVA